eukprot:CAMPEP_0184867116 /NCGR_PEP_ID=MMETSP0580-20130426/25053_1 /TAXON_ID=1118495 /ORGANISM="Dactyliosolen fragilissimus" /LENGTH=165 /DNA_ID=CAMNT_0027367165 /DNA_START=427 /DNA_END=921 /DNA_ORIENTATION=-
MKQLCSFSSIEDFWQYFNHLPKPSQVFFDGDTRKRVGPNNKTIEEYSLFKKGIEPEWSDPKNKTGGEWFCRSDFEGDGDVLDSCWQNLVFGVVGEVIEHGAASSSNKNLSHINGARVVDKGKRMPMFRLELWIDSKDPEVKEKIRAKLIDIITDGTRRGPLKFDW